MCPQTLNSFVSLKNLFSFFVLVGGLSPQNVVDIMLPKCGYEVNIEIEFK